VLAQHFVVAIALLSAWQSNSVKRKVGLLRRYTPRNVILKRHLHKSTNALDHYDQNLSFKPLGLQALGKSGQNGL
jgi:hypothetical protein